MHPTFWKGISFEKCKYRCWHEKLTRKIDGICARCKIDNYYTLINSTTVKFKYKLTSEDLRQLKPLFFKDPEKKYPEKLYFERNIVAIYQKTKIKSF